MSGTDLQNDGWRRIEPQQLARVSVVAQCLDNQWVPRSMLNQMLANAQSLEDVQEERAVRCHAEYMRSLVNAQQVVVNRAFFYNNPTVFSSYLNDHKQLSAIKTLLGGAALVPFLFQEKSPVEAPPFSADPAAVEGWRRMCQDTSLTCTRLSWNDELNTALTQEQLARRFAGFAKTAVDLAEFPGCAQRLARDLNLPAGGIPGLEARLREVARAQLDGSLHNREDLYRMFVVADGTQASRGCYDRSKPFAGEIKQLFDLQYNVGLPDALVRMPLTPQDSLGRSALQELDIQSKKSISAGDLVRLIRGRIFEVVQRDLNVPSFESIRPSDIIELRQTGEWAEYIARLETLLAIDVDFTHPDSIANGIQDVANSYGKLVAVIERMVHRPNSHRLRWKSAVTLAIKVAGAIAFVHFGIGAILLEAIGEVGTSTAAELVLEVIIGRTESVLDRTMPTTGYELFRGRMEAPREQWPELLSLLREVANRSVPLQASVEPSGLPRPT